LSIIIILLISFFLLIAGNLDFNLAGLLRNLTIEVDFQSKGQTVFTATTYAGYVGVLTGMRPGAFSISLDQRESGSPIENILMVRAHEHAHVWRTEANHTFDFVQ
jgi:N-acylethanolamine-hydrolysing acid amidase